MKPDKGELVLSAQSVEDRPSALLVLDGLLLGTHVRILVDSGASHNFVDAALVEHHRMTTMSKGVADSVRLADGSEQASSALLAQGRFRVGTYKDKDDFHVTPIQGADVILGKSWLTRLNPQIDWAEHKLTLKSSGRTHSLQGPIREARVAEGCAHLVLSSAELRQALRGREPMFL